MRIFIAGTDTNVGKTYVSSALLNNFNAFGFTTLGIKPVASGCIRQKNAWYNPDALALQQASSVKQKYELINPLNFHSPIAPHIAAKLENIPLSKEIILQKIAPALAIPTDLTLIEGVGGWLVPLNDQETMADVVKALKIPVILVVGIKLGCLNHALLTVRALQTEQINLCGWVANCIDPQALVLQENIQTLQKWISAPCLGIIPFQGNGEKQLDSKKIITACSAHFKTSANQDPE